MSVNSLINDLRNISLRLWASATRRAGRLASFGPCYCVYCEKKSPFFLPYFGGSKSAAPVLQKLDVVGSDLDWYSCPKCGSNDRERHLKIYCQRTDVERVIPGSRVLHFAPEHRFSAYVAGLSPSQHIKADLFPSAPDVQKVNMLDMGFPDESFDLVIANHVLEHVEDDAKALAEIHRVLRPGGLAVLQTPYSAMLTATFEDSGIVSRSARDHAYGQDDHVRLYGQDIFARFSNAGFISRVTLHNVCMPDIQPGYYGVNAREPFFLFERI